MNDFGNGEKIPDSVSGAIEFLEGKVSADLAIVQEHNPGQQAAVGDKIAHALRTKRLAADIDFIEELKEAQKQVEGSAGPVESQN